MSAFSVSEPFPTFHDRDGQPLDAGFLYFGTAGLPAQSSPIPVYIDAALTIPAAQPVRTTNGFPVYAGAACRLYVDADDFSVAVHDSDNTLVFSSLNATVRLPLAATTGGLSSDRVEYTEGGIGSTVRQLTSKLQESVSVFDFMTPAEIADVQAGTLLIDVTSSIAAALAAADEIFFPEGAYYVTNDGTPTSGSIQVLNGTAGKTLYGAGRGNTVIRNFGAGPCITSVGNPIIANVSLCIRDMTIQGQLGTAQGIFTDYTSQSVFERLELFDCGSDGIKIQRGAHNTLSDVWSRSNTFDGVLIGQEAYFTTITGGTFEDNGRHGINVAADGGIFPSGVTVVGASCRSNVQHNVSVTDGASNVRLFGSTSIATRRQPRRGTSRSTAARRPPQRAQSTARASRGRTTWSPSSASTATPAKTSSSTGARSTARARTLTRLRRRRFARASSTARRSSGRRSTRAARRRSSSPMAAFTPFVVRARTRARRPSTSPRVTGALIRRCSLMRFAFTPSTRFQFSPFRGSTLSACG